MWLRSLGLVVVFSIAACGQKVHVDNPDPFAEDDPRAVDKAKRNSNATTTAEAGLAGPKVQSGTIERASLNEVLERGLGAFLSGVEVQAYFANHGFAGWEVLRFWPKHNGYAKVDIRPGDVVIAINKRPLEKPDQVQRLWKELRTADRLVVSGHRLGTPFELRFKIRGSHKPAMP